jgi:acyl carrier protein
MTNAEVEAVLIAGIRECLEASGKHVDEMGPDTVPLVDIEGFDSLCALEVLVQMEAQYGLKAEIDAFFDGEGPKAKKRTVKQIAAAINEAIGA